MAAVRNSVLKYFLNSSPRSQSSQLCKSYTSVMGASDKFRARQSYANPIKSFDIKNFRFMGSLASHHLKSSSLDCPVNTQYYKTKPAFSHLHFRNRMPFIPVSPMLNYPSHSLSFSSKSDNPDDSFIASASNNTSDAGSELLDKVKGVWETAADKTTYTGQKAKEAYDNLTPHFQQLLDSNPYLKDIIVPVSSTLLATLLAWGVMPRLLRTFHKYSLKAPESLFKEHVPYEKSFWGALEDPVRYLVTFITFTQIGMMVAPSTIASQYLTQAWRGAAIMSLIWFLHRWKTNVFSRVLASATLAKAEREKYLTLDTVSSVGLFVIGLMASAEACGVAVQSIMTVGGIGGVATAFASRDILGNVMSGLSLQFSKTFSIGDTIKVGSFEGRVVEMGLTSTHLFSVDEFPLVVPNSLLSSQGILNKSRALCRAMVSKIPVNTVDLDKIPQIFTDIKTMIRSHPKVYLGKGTPCCNISQIDSSCAELTIAYNLQNMSKDELFTAQVDILIQSVRIIKERGATLAGTYQDSTTL